MSLKVICQLSHDLSFVADCAFNWKRYWPVVLMVGKNDAVSLIVVRPLSLVSNSSPSTISPVFRVTLVGSSGGFGEKYSCWKSPPPNTSNVVFSLLMT